jgi:short-subunit dehydrogenase
VVTALVTGATAGLGRAFVDRLAGVGHDVVLVSRTADRLQAVADEVARTHGVAAEVLAADLADGDDLDRVAARVASPDRPVELLVNNAGYGLNRPFLDTTAAEQQHYLDVLVRAVLRLSHAAGGAMAARRSGAIVNVGSVAAFAPLNAYSAHKAWVTTFSRALAGELAPHGVRVMACNPGFVRTEFHQRAGMATDVVPHGMWLDADTVVATALRDLARGRDLSVPDPRYKVLVAAMRHLPQRLVGRVGRGVRSRQGSDGHAGGDGP